jgi:hypothetical protein
MSNKCHNGTNKIASNKGRKGPRPIMTVAMLREKLMKEMMVKEVNKIDRKIGKLIRLQQNLQDKIYATQQALDRFRTIRAEYTNEVKA